MDTLTAPTPLESLVAELVATGGWFERVIVHMRRSAVRADQDDGDIAAILGELLCGALEGWSADRDATELTRAAEVLRSASERCAHEVLLVGDPHDLPRVAGRPRTRRRR